MSLAQVWDLKKICIYNSRDVVIMRSDRRKGYRSDQQGRGWISMESVWLALLSKSVVARSWWMLDFSRHILDDALERDQSELILRRPTATLRVPFPHERHAFASTARHSNELVIDYTPTNWIAIGSLRRGRARLLRPSPTLNVHCTTETRRVAPFSPTCLFLANETLKVITLICIRKQTRLMIWSRRHILFAQV